MSYKHKLTIFTATYNRAHLLERLYRSLLRQTCFDFEWLVIDDGSEDHTSQLFDFWCNNDNPFPIRYYRQENQGLIRTLNRGVALAKGEYMTKIDSDDYVLDDFVEKLVSWFDQIQNEQDIYGVSGLSVTKEGVPLKGSWPRMPDGADFVDATDLERAKYNLNADMSEAWRTDILRKHPFPVWEGEKFAPEQIVFFDIALEGWKIRWYPVPLAVCEYQQDGLTLGASQLEKKNPMGYAMMYNQRLKYATGFVQKFKTAMQCNALSFVGKHPEYILKSNAPLFSFIALFPGWLLSLRRRYQYREV